MRGLATTFIMGGCREHYHAFDNGRLRGRRERGGQSVYVAGWQEPQKLGLVPAGQSCEAALVRVVALRATTTLGAARYRAWN
eukprot:COSAG05_NODE_228_length_13388_cov_2.850403_8_plen_82_part_00